MLNEAIACVKDFQARAGQPVADKSVMVSRERVKT